MKEIVIKKRSLIKKEEINKSDTPATLIKLAKEIAHDRKSKTKNGQTGKKRLRA
jgi:hypothetical protein